MNKLYLSLLLVALTLLSCDNNESRLYRIQANGLFGFIDSIGNVIIEPQYKYVGPFQRWIRMRHQQHHSCRRNFPVL